MTRKRKKRRNQEDPEERFQEAVERIKDRYEPKIKRMLKEICDDAESRAGMGFGYSCEGPYDWSDETYKWSVMVIPEGKEKDEGVDVSIEIAQSDVYDGTLGGINFSLDVVGYEGQIVGGLTPYNYSPQVWVDVDDAEAVADRWRLFDDGVAPFEIVDTIAEFYARTGNPRSSKPKRSRSRKKAVSGRKRNPETAAAKRRCMR